MKDRIGFFAGCADALTELSAYYLAAAFVLSERWGLHLGWILLCTAVCSVLQTLFLQKQRSVPSVAALGAVLFGASLGVFLWKNETPAGVGMVVVLVIGAAMVMGCTMRYALKRPLLFSHILHLDTMLILLVLVVLSQEALEIRRSTVSLLVVVLLLDGAAAIGLRMTEGATDTEHALKASLVALGGGAIMTGVIGLLAAVFSRSGAVTDVVLHGIGRLLKTIGSTIQRFMEWLVSHIHVEEELSAPVMAEMTVMTEGEQIAIWKELSINPVIPAVIAGVLVLASAAVAVYQLRKNSLVRGTNTAVVSSHKTIRCRKCRSEALWAKLISALRFRWMAFVKRNTPGGVLLYAQRLARRRRAPRERGESMRDFLRRMDASGGLDGLADALDREYYGGMSRTMTARSCRETRRYIRKVVQHG